MDDLVSQVQMLETSKMKLEVEMQQMKKEHRRELQGKEDELEDARAAAVKKLKSLEQQLEQEHEERLGFLRERHEHEAKIVGLQDLLETSMTCILLGPNRLGFARDVQQQHKQLALLNTRTRR